MDLIKLRTLSALISRVSEFKDIIRAFKHCTKLKSKKELTINDNQTCITSTGKRLISLECQ